MLQGVFEYSRKGEEPGEVAAAMKDLDCPRGSSAGNSAMVLEYLRTLARTSFRADVVLMHVGMHDIKRDLRTAAPQVALTDYVRNVEEIVGWFDGRRIPLVWIRSGPLDERLHNARSKGFGRFEKDLAEYNRAAEAVLDQSGVEILDLDGFTLRLGPMDRLLKDHVHFKDEVVRLQAAFLAGWLAGKCFSGGKV